MLRQPSLFEEFDSPNHPSPSSRDFLLSMIPKGSAEGSEDSQPNLRDLHIHTKPEDLLTATRVGVNSLFQKIQRKKLTEPAQIISELESLNMFLLRPYLQALTIASVLALIIKYPNDIQIAFQIPTSQLKQLKKGIKELYHKASNSPNKSIKLLMPTTASGLTLAFNLLREQYPNIFEAFRELGIDINYSCETERETGPDGGEQYTTCQVYVELSPTMSATQALYSL